MLDRAALAREEVDARGLAAVEWYDADTVGIGEDLADLLSRSKDCVKLLGLDGTLDFMNCAGLEAMEIQSFDAVRGRIWWEIWPADSREMVRACFASAAGGREQSFVARCPTAQGSPREWRVSLQPMTTRDGRVSGVLSQSADITKAPAH